VFLLNRVAWLLATSAAAELRQGARALELAERAVRLSGGQDAESLDSLAVASAEVDRFDAAVRAGAEALRLARAQRRDDYVPELEARLSLYRSGLTYRAPQVK
jgi:hypothetical protein